MMTREDYLRELELLPVWRLRRAPPASDASPQPESAPMMEAPSGSMRGVASADGRCLFILEETADSAEEVLLLGNIFTAMRMKPQSKFAATALSQVLMQPQYPLVIGMGERVAQSLLQSNTSLAQLRNQTHAWKNTTLIVTYDLAHLLKNPLDKAQAWQDLCLGLQWLMHGPVPSVADSAGVSL